MRKLLNLLALNRARGSSTIKAEGNVIYVYDVIVASDEDAAWMGGCSAEGVVKALRSMTGPVEMRINSPGGDVFGGRAVASAMREYPGKITACVDGFAASAASLLAVSADECVMAPGSFLMIHKAWTIALGNADDFMATAALLEKIDGSLVETYTAKAGAGHDWSALLAAETWLSAQESVDMGLADRVSEQAVKNVVEWDLSAYASPPTVNDTTVTVTVVIEEDEPAEPMDPNAPADPAMPGDLASGVSATIDANYNAALAANEQQRRVRIAALRLRSIPA
jgi:ATP-dependent Clp protease protease subunit